MNYVVHRIHQPVRLDFVPERNAAHTIVLKVILKRIVVTAQ